MSHFTDFTGYVLFIITSFLAGVESADQCLLNSKVLSCFSGVIMSIRPFFLFYSNDGCTENCIKLRMNAGDKCTSNKKDNAIADTYGNKFLIPLDFEMLDSSAPYYQAGLGNRLCYEITFNHYNRVIKSAVASPDATYKISNISLEYEMVTQPTLAKHISDEYQNIALLYDRILRHRRGKVNKSDMTWNWSFNTPCKSLKGSLVLFEGEQPYARDTDKFCNPKIQKVSVIVEGKPNQLYAQGMR